MFKKALVAAAILAIPAAAAAHHGWTSYDEKRSDRIRTSLSDVKWGNPHGSANVRYKNATWHVVLAPVARMTARGLTKEMIGPKKQVVLEGYPRRDGTHEMRIERVIAGGKTVELR